MPHSVMLNVADLRDPNDQQGRSYRQVNASRQHAIPLGALVEMIDTGVRLFVVKHGRDCDQTPLYYLSHDPADTEQRDGRFRNASWCGGYPEDALRTVADFPK